MSDTIIRLDDITRGTDVSVVVTLTQPTTNAPVDITGRTLTVFDVPPALENKISAEILDAPAGKIKVKVEGTAPVPTGVYKFRVQLNGDDSLGYPEFRLCIV
jgi:hypothetical protein